MSLVGGRYTTQMVELTNPTEETLNLIPFLSNTNNYSLDINMSQSVELRAQSTVKIPLNFSPSTLGTTDHQCKVSFICEQVLHLVVSSNAVNTK